MYALIVTILVFAGTPEDPAVISSAVTTVPGFASLELCEAAAAELQASNLNADRFADCVLVSEAAE